MRERPVTRVPLRVLILLVLAIALQMGWHALRPGPRIDAQALPAPPAEATLRIASFGDPWVLSKLLMLWLQAFDNQPGISVPFASLDYERVRGWLDRILELDPLAHYPLLAASRLYGAVSDPEKQRQMCEFVRQKFLEDPNRRWRWLAHCAIAAKHRLGDLRLALELAEEITAHADGPEVPGWAKHMSVVLLEDLGEPDAAALLTYKLLESGVVTDPREIRFLSAKLEELEAARIGQPRE